MVWSPPGRELLERVGKHTVSRPPHAVVTIDEQGRIVEFDRGAEEVFGLRRCEALGRLIADLTVKRLLESDHGTLPGQAPPVEPARKSNRLSGVPAERGDVSQARIELTVRRADETRAPSLVSSWDPSGQGSAEFESALQALLEHAEEMAQTGTWDWSLEADEAWWSGNLYRIFGLEPGEITPTPRYVVSQTHPDDRERVEREIDSARAEGRLQPIECRIVRPDGVVRHLRASQTVVKQAGGRPRRIIGSVQDITEWHQTEAAIAAHLAVAEALMDWQTLEQGATGLLRNLAVALDCVAGVLWLPEGDVLVAHVVWRSESTGVAELESMIRQLRLPRGVGLAGQVWESAEPRIVLSLQDDPRFRPEAVAALRGAIALPAIHAQEVLAVLEFFWEALGVDPTDRLLRSLTGIGYELGEFLVHRRGKLKPSPLTPRELQVLQLAAQGCNGPEIARRLVVRPATVGSHFEHIYAKYGVSDRTAAVAKALRDGLIE